MKKFFFFLIIVLLGVLTTVAQTTKSGAGGTVVRPIERVTTVACIPCDPLQLRLIQISATDDLLFCRQGQWTKTDGTPYCATNSTPVITTLSPSSVTAGVGSFILTVNGSNFVSGSKVRWNGVDRVTNFVNSTQITATITSGDVSSAGTASVTVFTPEPGGGTSNLSTFTINSAGGGGTIYYASTTGTGSSCTLGSPCSLTTILNHANGTSIVGAGGRIYLRGGTYFLPLPAPSVEAVQPVTKVYLPGSVSQRIIIENYPGEKVIIQNGIEFADSTSNGYVTIRGIEFTASTFDRFPVGNSSATVGIAIKQKGIYVEQCYIHDTAIGVSVYNPAEGAQIRDSIITGCWLLNQIYPGRPSGIGIYFQQGTLPYSPTFTEGLLTNNILFDNGVNMKFFASAGTVHNVRAEKLISFASGRPTAIYSSSAASNGVLSGVKRMSNLELGTDANAVINAKFRNNVTYQDDWGQNVMLGWANQNSDKLIFSDNIIVGDFPTGSGSSNHPLVELSYFRNVTFQNNKLYQLQGSIFQNVVAVMQTGDTTLSANYVWNNNLYYTAFTHPFAYRNCSGCGANYTLSGWQGLGFDDVGSSVTAPTGKLKGFNISTTNPKWAFAWAYDFDTTPATTHSLDMTGFASAGTTWKAYYATNPSGAWNGTGFIASGTATGTTLVLPNAIGSTYSATARFCAWIIIKD